ncbi:MAG: DNA polymerase ligase N-terminal domain-containing protein [Candidatus Doudnabacteria bacterium]
MSLKKYQQKRKFNQTPEPKGKEKKAKGALRFVVQKHQARQLHYDFRLEHDGVLLSWAVPKGPSLRLGEKHLAMMVEDHPIDYMKFEGTIPEGNYGAGTVMVWDFGTYLALGTGTVTDSEKLIKKGLRAGMLKFVLNGKKLQGGFALIKTNFFGKNSWLLIKEKDEHAKKIDITKKNKSVISDKTLEQLAKTHGKVWISKKKT